MRWISSCFFWCVKEKLPPWLPLVSLRRYSQGVLTKLPFRRRTYSTPLCDNGGSFCRVGTTADLFDKICTAFFSFLKIYASSIFCVLWKKSFLQRSKLQPKPSKRSQVQIWNVHKPWKIGIATRAKRSAVIPTAQKYPPLSHKGVEISWEYLQDLQKIFLDVYGLTCAVVSLDNIKTSALQSRQIFSQDIFENYMPSYVCCQVWLYVR